LGAPIAIDILLPVKLDSTLVVNERMKPARVVRQAHPSASKRIQAYHLTVEDL
jgi:hypothetical protein